ncbi:MAG: hypothetical protein QG660_289 [Pseudomonadota bacterium]|nr:hypothetical protein [Propionivibrio sp.]MDQ5905717.1 hypothetical protein [Pseudomonadota bacterium]MDQ5917180.1 hypothetical protein [Pseudomonadota bacterium]MDQ5944627.1 hypothetical protein [Pseudomonadota bacterium]HPP47755.1 hypothetical protein [Accumulibacter sp.]
MTISAEELSTLTPDEQEAVLAAQQPETVAEETTSEEVAPVDSAESDDGAAEPGDGEQVADDAAEEVIQPAGFVPQFDASAPEGVAEQIAALNERELALEAQFNDGEIDAPELSRAMREISSKRTELLIDQKQAEWAAKQNAEIEQQFNARITRQFFDKPAAKLYEDTIMYRLLDATVADLRTSAPEKGYEWALNEADRLVRQRIGGNAPSLKPVEAPRAKEVPPTVRTIGNLPAAAPAPVGDDRAEKIGMLEGEDLEKYVGRLSADDRKKLSRAA